MGRVADGEYLGDLWAVATVLPGDPPDVESEFLADNVLEIGVQGVRPLAAEEVATLETKDRACGAIVARTPSAEVRPWYQLWLRTQGIAGTIRRWHPDFFEWVELEA